MSNKEVIRKVVSYRNSTSNHNTMSDDEIARYVVSYRNSTSNHNDVRGLVDVHEVVSYRNSTSNHNPALITCAVSTLYLIEILHQTTTGDILKLNPVPLYLIEILHQTTTIAPFKLMNISCILSKFYIKPQHQSEVFKWGYSCILSKFYIKPQHWVPQCIYLLRCILSKFYIKPQRISRTWDRWGVVSYRNSTSNHNYTRWMSARQFVVSYRNSTSNHNFASSANSLVALYLIEILHQTTTQSRSIITKTSCILSKFYIKPQLVAMPLLLNMSCILSKFYIKPQHRPGQSLPKPVVSYRNSTSNHNVPSRCMRSNMLYLIEILHQTTTVRDVIVPLKRCILSKFYIKPQPCSLWVVLGRRCILSKFYIKPQLCW